MKVNKEELLVELHALSNGKKLYIVGAGRYGQIIGEWLEGKGICWIGYIDKNKVGDIKGHNIEPYSRVNGDDYYLISTFTYKNEILRELLIAGANNNHIIVLKEQEIIYDIIEELNGLDSLKNISLFRNIHAGERCFLVGNGPSLEIKDLEKISKEYSFGCNTVYALYGQTNWRPDYYVYGDPSMVAFLKDNADVYEELRNNSVVFSPIVSGVMSSVEKAEKHYYYKSLNAKNRKKPDFSADCSICIYTQGTIMYQMLQLAAYMGFSEIYLIGVDFSFSVEKSGDGHISRNDIVNHMGYIEEEEKKLHKYIIDNCGETYIADIDWQKAGYEAAEEYALNHNIKIYNATRGGKLEVFERIGFDSLFE